MSHNNHNNSTRESNSQRKEREEREKKEAEEAEESARLEAERLEKEEEQQNEMIELLNRNSEEMEVYDYGLVSDKMSSPPASLNFLGKDAEEFEQWSDNLFDFLTRWKLDWTIKYSIEQFIKLVKCKDRNEGVKIKASITKVGAILNGLLKGNATNLLETIIIKLHYLINSV